MSVKLHRWFNTSLLTVMIVVVLLAIGFGYNKFESISIENKLSSEMMQITDDEGFRKCAYKDSLGFRTIGFGHLVQEGENFSKCITISTAMRMLQEDYSIAISSVEYKYPWAEGEVKLVLANMSYQLGSSRLSKFQKMLSNLENKRYNRAAVEMMDSRWAKQTPQRSMRLAIRVLSLASN